ncbi:hypothetical protein [Aeoliella mucimassa]|uniref:Uncharacterized protein n=1 Tax=Aeoliella mucimassa TaxID=2527972 RepID=A0A518AI98_9BACT|nr:hypothetical protein [Aeoliella mucimassa]QDU54455.1 hypothetical protein Pan181_06370 [Aeoliella mucimassa]
MDEPSHQSADASAKLTKGQIGPMTRAMVLILAIVDLAIFLANDGPIADSRYLLIMGFAYGQSAAAGLWVFSDQNHRKGLTIVLAEVVLLVNGSMISTIDGSNRWEEYFTTLLQILVYSHLAIGFMILDHVLRCLLDRCRPMEQPLWFFRFRMLHLLVAMFATAAIAMLLRFTPGDYFEYLIKGKTLIAQALAALLPTAAGILLLNSPVQRWRIGLFIAIMLLISLTLNWLIDAEELYGFLLSNACTIAAILLIPRLDRYKFLNEHPPRGGPA